MFELTFPRHGQILNRNYGVESAAGLTIKVTGIGGEFGPVTVNGVAAEFDGVNFSAEITLTEQFNTITAVYETNRGRTTREIQVVWDKASFPRYNFFIDDHIFFLTDIARSRPKSLFDHFYLKFLREMNRKYGTKFTLNVFFRNDHDRSSEPFTLDKFPDCYRGEWRENSEWLKLAFHAYSEFPDRTYQNASAETLAKDMELINGEIVRFAGEETLFPPVALHWAMARPEVFGEFTSRGVRALEGQFLNPRTGIADSGSVEYVCDVGYFVNLDDARFLEQQGVFYDFRHKLAFYRGDCTANLCEIPQIPGKIELAAGKKKDFISLATHEQYSFDYYFNYLPDHFQRIDKMLQDVTERGFKPVHFAEGWFGNTAFGK